MNTVGQPVPDPLDILVEGGEVLDCRLKGECIDGANRCPTPANTQRRA